MNEQEIALVRGLLETALALLKKKEAVAVSLRRTRTGRVSTLGWLTEERLAKARQMASEPGMRWSMIRNTLKSLNGPPIPSWDAVKRMLKSRGISIPTRQEDAERAPLMRAARAA
jgi:hypothetical protein